VSGRRPPRSALAWIGIQLIGAGTAAAQVPQTGAEMYRAWCAVCHADDGAGRAPNRPVKTPPMDFTDCRTTTAEPDADWEYVIARGGPAAGLSPEMPAFEVLTPDQIGRLVAYVRTFCREPRWPSGNLNLRRAIFTAKAFPEYEAVLTPVVSHGQGLFAHTRVTAEYAARVGRRGQIEVGVPAESINTATGRVVGLGDVAFGAKYVLRADVRRSWIVSGAVEVTVPTGSRRYGFGEGTTVVESLLATGWMWRGFAIQADVRAEYFTKKVPLEIYHHFSYNASFSRDLTAAPSTWTLGLEAGGVGDGFGIAPYVIKGLTRSGTLSAAFGVRIPVRAPLPLLEDSTRYAGYILWDYGQLVR
jgi:mono/diheme cytochrome c family protein